MSTKADLVTQLGAVPLFSGLSPKALKAVAAAASVVQHADGKEITAQGESGVGFHLVLEGHADVLVDGKPVGTVGPGDSFGEISLLDGGPRSATVRCTGPVSTAVLSGWDFRPLLDREPEIARGLLLGLCKRLRATESRATL